MGPPHSTPRTSILALFFLLAPIYGQQYQIANFSTNFTSASPTLSRSDGIGRKFPLQRIDKDAQVSLRDEKACQSVEINSEVANFERLRNCTVIEGFLKISLIDRPEKPFEGLSFPELREVTDFVLFYRVTGMKTLKNIFPNLAVIRGKKLFGNYALVVFENPDLEELGLVGLTRIEQGSVFVWKNNFLCYVDTIDWKKLTVGDYVHGNSIKENKPEDQCVNQCPAFCPKFFEVQQRFMCWTSSDCQKAPEPVCGDKAVAGSCCHNWCLSGCYGIARNECLTCKYVHHEGACMDKCPMNTFKLHNRRCVSEETCRAFTEVLDDRQRKWKAHDGTCVPDCPPRYTEDKTDPHKCVPCVGSCPKVCGSAIIDTVATAQQLAQCTLINGSLEIQIGQGEQIVRILEETLQNIEEVRDYVKIIRSHALLSLSFFKRLKVIRGVKLGPGGYALTVIDNRNLQDLFTFNALRPNITVINPAGRISFHFNPRLCMNKIETLVLSVNSSKPLSAYDNRDISPTSNGDRVACDIKKLALNVASTGPASALLLWNIFQLEDPRSLLGYVLLYRESSTKNLTKYEGRDACSGDVWVQMDIAPHQESESIVTQILTDLRPARQYAAYVKTYTIASERQGAESDIVYFNTSAKQPSKPIAVRTESINATAIKVYWRPPQEPNGVVAYYSVRWYKAKDQHDRLAKRNYCQNPIQLPGHYFAEADSTTTMNPVRTCPCNGSSNVTFFDTKPHPKHSHSEVEKDYEQAVIMENLIQDNVYVKKRERRAIVDIISPLNSVLTTSFIDASTGKGTFLTTRPTLSTSSPENVTSRQNTTTTNSSGSNTTTKPSPVQVIMEKKIHDGSTFVILPNLYHFTNYIILVEACHENNKGVKQHPEQWYDKCSGGALSNPSQTLARHGADDIPSQSVAVSLVISNDTESNQNVIISWQDPMAPNGVIVTVDIEYQRESGQPRTECVPRTQDKNTVHTIDFTRMHTGNYSFRLRASSFAGNGSWTEPQYIYFTQPMLVAPGFSPGTLAGIIAGVFLIFLILGAACFYYFQRRYKKIPDAANIVSINPDYYSYKPDEWEFPRENIELGRELGVGSFGKVYEGWAKNIIAGVERMRVAVKTVNEDKSTTERNFFLQEASIMKSFRCNHVVKLLGVVSEGQPALVIMEIMLNGDLKNYLRSMRPDDAHPEISPPTFSLILQMAGQICDGMAYIHSRKFVHRDLAARNCMVAEDMTVKIGDFGMTRDVYETDYYRKGGKGLLPVRWMAPESLKDGLFTDASDVWSFGVVLWEMATLAAQPYQGLSNEEVLRFVVEGKLMEAPENVPERLWRMMTMCWQFDPAKRPTFLKLIVDLLPDLDDKFRQLSYFCTVDMTDTGAYETHAPSSESAEGQELTDLSPKVFSLLIDPESLKDEDEDVAFETDRLLSPPIAPIAGGDNGVSPTPSRRSGDREALQGVTTTNNPPLEPSIMIHQNGGSQTSSADNSKGMPLAFPQDGPRGPIGNKMSNGNANGLIPRIATLY